MAASRALWSRRVLCPDGIKPAAVVIEGERIRAVEPEPPPDVPLEDLGQRLIAPSLVDTHVHVNEPGRTEWEGFETATRAAAAGGITAIVDMPLNSSPVTTTPEALQAKLEAARGKLWVDCGFWGGVVPGNAEQLGPMVDLGVLGFKAFLCDSGIDEFPASTPADLRQAMPILAGRGVPLLAHCELESELRQAPRDASPQAYLRYLHTRPREAEDRAIELMIELSRETGCHVHVVHLSSGSALPAIRAAKAAGIRLTVETCPHYLCLAAEAIADGATAFKCAPPIREGSNREALWAGLLDGTIDVVVTDHSPCVPALKRLDDGDFERAWGGIASLQLGLRTVWTEAQRRGAQPQQVIRWMGSAPRQLVGWPAHHGVVAGASADLIAWDLDTSAQITEAELLQRHPITPWLGRAVVGRVESTWLRGQPILQHGRPGPVPTGRPILREHP